MKLLITGGCGFLGSNLASDAMMRGDDVCIFDNLFSYGSRENLFWLKQQGKFIFRYGDIRFIDDIRNALRDFKPDVIFHLAGQVAMTTSLDNPMLDFQTNAFGTFNLLESVRQHIPNAIVIYSSTNKVYGDLGSFQYRETDTRYICLDKPAGFGEDIPLCFQSPYGCSKGSADQYMLDYARMFDLNTVVFRHSSMFGGRQFSTYDQGWIGWFCQKAVEKVKNDKLSFTISGNGKQVRDVLHADDMKKLYIAAVNNISNARGEAFNIGGGKDNSLSLLELFDILESKMKVHLDFTRLPMRISDQRVFVADISKAKLLLGWQPLVTASDGITSTLRTLVEDCD